MPASSTPRYRRVTVNVTADQYARLQQQAAQRTTSLSQLLRELLLERLPKHDIAGLLNAIKAGFHDDELKAEWNGLHARKTALEAQLESMKHAEPLLHPGMAAVYRKKVAQLVRALESADVEERESARSEIRVVITKIVIAPGDAKLRVEGNLGEMLAIAASGRIRSTLAAVANNGCGGSQPPISAALAAGSVSMLPRRAGLLPIEAAL